MRHRHVVLGAIAMLALLFPPSGRSQSSTEYVAAQFTSRCPTCWPGWTELFKPVRGVGPRTQNGLAFLFINGSLDDPQLNQSHLHFSLLEGPIREVLAEFSFNNATIGGRLVLTNGNFFCLSPSFVTAFVTEELFILTLRDEGETWYGAFLGDLALLDPQFAPAPERADPYTSVGLLEKTPEGFIVHALAVIPQVTRFSPITVRLLLEDTADASILRATFQLAGRKTIEVRSELDPTELRSDGKAGVLYMVGNGSPCTSLTQREIALRSFRVR